MDIEVLLKAYILKNGPIEILDSDIKEVDRAGMFFTRVNDSKNEKVILGIEKCPWCDDDGWYYPTDIRKPMRVRCNH